MTTDRETGAEHDHTASPYGAITVFPQVGLPRTFRDTWAIPEYLIPLVAHFLAWVDDGGLRLTMDTWLAYGAAFPDALPREEITDAAATDSDSLEKLHYRYELELDEDSGAVLLCAHSLRGPRQRLLFELTRANLFAEAAALCGVMADRAQRYADDNGGTPPPGNEPEVWRRHEARFRRIHASTAVTALGVNAAARFVPATFNEPYPGIQVAGAWIFAYVDQNGTLRISAHLEETERWLLRPDETVPMQVRIQDTVVFEG